MLLWMTDELLKMVESVAVVGDGGVKQSKPLAVRCRGVRKPTEAVSQ